jgi:hypothetical protein
MTSLSPGPVGVGAGVPLAAVSGPTQHMAAAANPSLHSTAVDNTKIRTVLLGSGMLLSFTDNDVPDPTAVSFAHDIDRLAAMWDDGSSRWRGDSVLMIKGHAIALKHWPTVYKYGKPGQWKGTKNKWAEWRVGPSGALGQCVLTNGLARQYVVERFCQGTAEEFWAEFTVPDGKRMAFTNIVATLREARLRRDAEISAQASQAGSVQYTYRKGSRTHTMQRPHAIAKRFLNKHTG